MDHAFFVVDVLAGILVVVVVVVDVVGRRRCRCRIVFAAVVVVCGIVRRSIGNTRRRGPDDLVALLEIIETDDAGSAYRLGVLAALRTGKGGQVRKRLAKAVVVSGRDWQNQKAGRCLVFVTPEIAALTVVLTVVIGVVVGVVSLGPRSFGFRAHDVFAFQHELVPVGIKGFVVQRNPVVERELCLAFVVVVVVVVVGSVVVEDVSPRLP